MPLNTLLHPLANALHVLSVVVWVGGMFFAYLCLRPVAASVLEPPQRLTLWARVFDRFFPWVWLAIVLLLVTGFGMMFGYFGGMKTAPYIHAMMGIGIVMMLIFFHVFFAPYRRLKHAVDAQDWQGGARHLAQIRKLVGVNTLLGLLVVVIAAGGHWLAT
jgi:uncharacterized membrane protein